MAVKTRVDESIEWRGIPIPKASASSKVIEKSGDLTELLSAVMADVLNGKLTTHTSDAISREANKQIKARKRLTV